MAKSEIKAELTNNDFFRICLCAVTQPTNLPIFLDLFLYFRIMLSREKALKIVAVNFYIAEVDEIILNQTCSFISLLCSAFQMQSSNLTFDTLDPAVKNIQRQLLENASCQKRLLK